MLQFCRPQMEANSALQVDSGNRDDCYDWCEEPPFLSVRSEKSVKT